MKSGGIHTDRRRNGAAGELGLANAWQNTARSVPHRDAAVARYTAVPQDGGALHLAAALAAAHDYGASLALYEPAPTAPGSPAGLDGRPAPVRWAAPRAWLWDRLPAGDLGADVIILRHDVWLEGKTSEGTRVRYVVAWRSEVVRPALFHGMAVITGAAAPLQLDGAAGTDGADQLDQLDAADAAAEVDAARRTAPPRRKPGRRRKGKPSTGRARLSLGAYRRR